MHRSRTWVRRAAPALLLGVSLVGCSKDAPKAQILSVEELRDPQTCKECHPQHYDQWSGSMHAYAAADPVFLAMNRRGQEEAELGDFCIKCHAPMAVDLGYTSDGLNLDEVPPELLGITCYFCHNVASVEGTHNNPLVLAHDQTMRGSLGGPDGEPGPSKGAAHETAYSALHDSRTLESSDLCGACHDIKTDKVDLERTFAEWKDSIFSDPEGLSPNSCGSCHLKRDARLGTIADTDHARGGRRFHRHDFEGVDVALTDFPNQERQRLLIEYSLRTTLLAQLCMPNPLSAAFAPTVVLENAGAGHSFPSGARQDRRVWLEVVGWKDGAVIYESGAVPNDQPVLDDPTATVLRDVTLDADGQPAHMFWDVASIQGLDRGVGVDIAAVKTFDLQDPGWHRELWSRTLAPMSAFPDRVTLRVRVRPMGLDVLDDVVESGHLSAGVREQMQDVIFDVPKQRCYSEAVVARNADLPVALHADCDPDSDEAEFTLVWTPELAEDTGDRSCVADPGIKSRSRAPTENGSEGVVRDCAGKEVYVDNFSAGMSRDGNAFEVTIEDAAPAPPALDNNRWVILVTDRQGNAVSGATVSVTPEMPDHGHGTPILADVTELGDGRYALEPINMFMAGRWAISVSITATDGTTDTVQFVFCAD